jgi:hypothetical protein
MEMDENEYEVIAQETITLPLLEEEVPAPYLHVMEGPIFLCLPFVVFLAFVRSHISNIGEIYCYSIPHENSHYRVRNEESDWSGVC